MDEKPTSLRMLVMREGRETAPEGSTIDPKVVWPLNQRDSADMDRIVKAFGRMPYGGGVVSGRAVYTLDGIATNLEALADALTFVAVENDRIKVEHTALLRQRAAMREFMGTATHEEIRGQW